GPVCAALKVGDAAAPVSTIPFALGACPGHETRMPRCAAFAAVQPLPKLAAVRSVARAAFVPALVWWIAGVPAASTIASTTLITRYPMRVATRTRSTDFVALGDPGSDHYAGLETFANPGVARVELDGDELTAVCPITGQPDLYRVRVQYEPDGLCLES